jgi:hypothetical protein
MLHTMESLELEFQNLQHRPAADSPPPILCAFTVDIVGDCAAYVKRLRAALSAAVNVGVTADFEEEDLPIDDVPEWLIAIGVEGGERAPDFSKSGRDAYVGQTGQRPWSLQNWLHRFDPDEDSRGWEWWDVTPAGSSRVRIWVDSWGESFFGCLDLLWVAYAAGAHHVEGPTVRRAEDWVAEATAGGFDDF